MSARSRIIILMLPFAFALWGCGTDPAPTQLEGDGSFAGTMDAGSDVLGLFALAADSDKALPPCITITDTQGYVWTINRNFGQINGTVVLPGGCGVYQFTGTSSFLSAWTDTPAAGCCESFTYFVEVLDIPGRSASGTWFDSCGNSGNWATVDAGACK